MCGYPQPGHHHQQGMLELQDMPAAPEQHFEVNLFLDLRHCGPGPDKGGQRQKRRHRPEKSAELQRRAKQRSRPGRDQRAQHGETETRAADPQRSVEHLLLQDRNVVVEHRIGARQKRRNRHHCGTDRRQHEAAPAQPGHAVTPQRTPDHRGKRHEPDRHRQVDMNHQGGAEHVLQRENVLDSRRARQHQQNGQQPGADQRHQPQPQPCSGQGFGRPSGNRYAMQIHYCPRQKYGSIRQAQIVNEVH